MQSYQGELLDKEPIKEGSKREIVIFSCSLSGPLNGADAHIPSSMELPEEGIWRDQCLYKLPEHLFY